MPITLVYPFDIYEDKEIEEEVDEDANNSTTISTTSER